MSAYSRALLRVGCIGLLLSACSVYDPHGANPRPPLKPEGGMDMFPEGGSDLPDSGADTGMPSGCESRTTCSPECPEQCNGRDDDCDELIDENAGDTLCKVANATAVCDHGACLVVACAAQFRDCDDDPDNGCEVSADDPNHCGSCGYVCSVANAAAACRQGKCVAADCNDGFGDCDGDEVSCEQRLVTLDHCGGCNTRCGELANATSQCSSGACGVKECLGNFGNCDGNTGNGCEMRLDSLERCGGCDTPCNKASCVGGVCTAAQCTHPMADCNGDEVDCEANILTNAAHCGGCGNTCTFDASSPNAALSCVNGECAAACTGPYGDCDGDYANGCETGLLTATTHCGACGTNCNTQFAHVAQTSCTAGTCNIVTCANGWADCDNDKANGCERNTAVEGPCFPDTNCTKQISGTHEYYYCTNASTWSAARTKCQTQSRGDLVVISSSTENSFVQSLRSGDVWIGARDASIEGLWRWERNGQPFWRGVANGSAQLSQYENWPATQPDDSAGNEDCGELIADGTWNDTACTGTKAFVCEVMPDECSSDPNKIDPGQCGCGTPDTDTDSDGFANCNDRCPADPTKQSDADTDGDGTPNCLDGCPADPTQQATCLTFQPTNFDPTGVNWSGQPVTNLNCGTITIDTTDPDGTGPLVATLTNWCGTAPTPYAQDQSGGPQAVVVPLRGLTVASGNTLRLIGPRPVILAVDGNVTVGGIIDANASGTTAGAGGNWSCGGSQGGNGGGQTSRFDGASGGGGGGFGTAGGRGGTADTDGSDVPGGAPGASRGSSNLSPLMGGCAGGRAGDCATNGGSGGGAVQISASGSITVSGTVRANGGAGSRPCGGSDEGGGTGGGSGGGIFFEATAISTGGATIQANGGVGGNNGDYAGIYNCGNDPGGSGSTNASNSGADGSGCQGGGPGAGGGYGRVRTLVR